MPRHSPERERERSPARRRSSRRSISPVRATTASRKGATRSPLDGDMRHSKRSEAKSPPPRSPSPRTKRLRRVEVERNGRGRNREREKGSERDDARERGEKKSERDGIGGGEGSKSRRDRLASSDQRPRDRRERPSRSPPPRDARKGAQEEENIYGEAGEDGADDSISKMKVAEDVLESKQKQKPSFELYGKLVSETDRVRAQYGSKMSSKKLKTISINREGKQTVRPPTHYGHRGTSLTTQFGPRNSRFPTSSFPNDYLPTKRNCYKDDDDIDYDANDSEANDSDSDDGGMGCDQQNDLAFDDELGHEAQLDVIDASGCRRKRGITRLENIWNLPKGQRITVEFNRNFQIVGENSTVFPRFLGTMARKGEYCPLNYLTWPKVPKEYKKHCLTTIESKFILKYHNDDDMVRKCWTRYALSCLGRKWRDFRNELKDKFFDVSKTPEQMAVGIPSSVNPTQMKCLIEYWLSPEGLARSAKNKLSRSLQKDVHTLGGKTYAQLAHELEKKDGRAQTRSDLYIKSRKRKTGEAVTEIAAKNIEEMERLILQQDVDPSQGIHDQIVCGEGDIYSQVISKEERRGRIRGLGFRPVVGCTSGSSSKSTYSDLMEQHMNDANIIKSLQEKILQHEKERAEEQKAMEEERKEIFARLRIIEQFLPQVNFDHGSRGEAFSGIQTKSSCASHHEGDNN